MTLQPHLETGCTTIARAWRLVRADGVVLGFTDHDRDLTFAGVTCRAGAGLTGRALEQVTGLAPDNTEAVGALSDAGLTEGDILAGRYDRAQVTVWEVNWTSPAQRRVVFRGSLGEISRDGTAFRAELRGLSDDLTHPGGRVYSALCSADLGDAGCKVNLNLSSFRADLAVLAVQGAVLRLDGSPHAGQWFRHGRVQVMTGAAAGLGAMIRDDRRGVNARRVTLWQELRAPLAPGDVIRLQAGCDKAATTCRAKFDNFLNFRGFPHLPGEDWVTAYARPNVPLTGRKMRD